MHVRVLFVMNYDCSGQISGRKEDGHMSKAKRYSPQIAPDLLPVLYRERVARKIPMTLLVNRLIRAALRYEGVIENELAARVAETAVAAETKEP